MFSARSLLGALLSCALFLTASAAAAGEITVFAAASMHESMNEIAGMYAKVAPAVKIVYNFDSSGTLKKQIESGAECDLFISAAQKQMDALEKQGFILSDTRFNLVANKVVLVVPAGHNTTGISSFEDIPTDKVSLISIGNSDVPVGQYSEDIFRYMGIWDDMKNSGKVTFAGNVKEVLSQVAAGTVSCGIVYGTDAASSKGKVTVIAVAPAESHKPVTYPAALLKNGRNLEEARAFLEYLRGDDCAAIFEKIGFTRP